MAFTLISSCESELVLAKLEDRERVGDDEGDDGEEYDLRLAGAWE
jgi:hypothetical protein